MKVLFGNRLGQVSSPLDVKELVFPVYSNTDTQRGQSTVVSVKQHAPVGCLDQTKHRITLVSLSIVCVCVCAHARACT